MAGMITGRIVDGFSGGLPVTGMRVSAWDEDWPDGDDFMGRDITDQDGSYRITYPAGLWDAQVPGLPSWRPDIYITVEIKNTQDQWVQLGKSQVYKDCDLSQDLCIDLEVQIEPVIQRTTNFSPAEHGFHFINSFTVKPQILNLDIEQKGMGFCGGMCAGALYRFLRNIPVPPDRISPQQGTALFDDLQDRQIRSMYPSVLTKMFRFQGAPDLADLLRKESIGQLSKREWPILKSALDNGMPTILVLIRSKGVFDNPTKNHQVLAIAYSFNPATRDLIIETYDPNKPDLAQTLSMNLGLPDGKLYIRDSAHRGTRGFYASPVSTEISS